MNVAPTVLQPDIWLCLNRLAPLSTTGPTVEQDDGLLPRCLVAAYQGIDQQSDNAEFSVTASCIELYNEAVTDLLGADKDKQLQVCGVWGVRVGC